MFRFLSLFVFFFFKSLKFCNLGDFIFIFFIYLIFNIQYLPVRNSFATHSQLLPSSFASLGIELRESVANTSRDAADATRDRGERLCEFVSIGRLIKPRVYIRIWYNIYVYIYICIYICYMLYIYRRTTE